MVFCIILYIIGGLSTCASVTCMHHNLIHLGLCHPAQKPSSEHTPTHSNQIHNNIYKRVFSYVKTYSNHMLVWVLQQFQYYNISLGLPNLSLVLTYPQRNKPILCEPYLMLQSIQHNRLPLVRMSFAKRCGVGFLGVQSEIAALISAGFLPSAIKFCIH